MLWIDFMLFFKVWSLDNVLPQAIPPICTDKVLLYRQSLAQRGMAAAKRYPNEHLPSIRELFGGLNEICIMLKLLDNSLIGDYFRFGQRFAAAIPLCARLCINKLGDGLRPNFVQSPDYNPDYNN